MKMYECARCGYETIRKSNMQNHLKRKKSCPNVNNVELTKEIKETIIRDRKHHETKQYNITNNIYIIGQEAIENVMRKMEKEMPNFIDTTFFKRRELTLLNHKEVEESETECHEISDFFEYIMEFLENERGNKAFTMFIKTHMLHLYNEDVWQTKPVMTGMKKMIKLLKELILDAYEISVARQLQKWKTRCKAKELLSKYYEFIQSFDMKSVYLEEKNNDNKILYNNNEIEYDNEMYSSYECIEDMSKLWNDTLKRNKDYRRNEKQKKLKEIIEYHTDETSRSIKY